MFRALASVRAKYTAPYRMFKVNKGNPFAFPAVTDFYFVGVSVPSSASF